MRGHVLFNKGKLKTN